MVFPRGFPCLSLSSNIEWPSSATFPFHSRHSPSLHRHHSQFPEKSLPHKITTDFTPLPVRTSTMSSVPYCNPDPYAPIDVSRINPSGSGCTPFSHQLVCGHIRYTKPLASHECTSWCACPVFGEFIRPLPGRCAVCKARVAAETQLPQFEPNEYELVQLGGQCGRACWRLRWW